MLELFEEREHVSDLPVQESFLEEETCEQALKGPARFLSCGGARVSRSKERHGMFGGHGMFGDHEEFRVATATI